MLCWSSRAALSLSNLTGIKTTEQITGSIIISMTMKGLYNPSEKKYVTKTRQHFFSPQWFLSFLLHIMVANCLKGKKPQVIFQKQNFQALTQEWEVTKEGNPYKKKKKSKQYLSMFK